MLYGTTVWGNSPYDVGSFPYQMPMFRCWLKPYPKYIGSNKDFWLRTQIGGDAWTYFHYGVITFAWKDIEKGVKPYFLLK